MVTSFEAGAVKANVATLFRRMLHVMTQKQHLVFNKPTCCFLLNYVTQDKNSIIKTRLQHGTDSNEHSQVIKGYDLSLSLFLSLSLSLSHTHTHTRARTHWVTSGSFLSRKTSLQFCPVLLWLTAIIRTRDDKHSKALMLLSGAAKRRMGTQRHALHLSYITHTHTHRLTPKCWSLSLRIRQEYKHTQNQASILIPKSFENTQ